MMSEGFSSPRIHSLVSRPSAAHTLSGTGGPAYREVIGPEDKFDPRSASENAVVKGGELSGLGFSAFRGRRWCCALVVDNVPLVPRGGHVEELGVTLNRHFQ